MNEGRLIRLSKSCLGLEEKNAVMRVLDRGYLGMGIEVQEFERNLEKFFGRPAVCVVNGTAALQLALQACNVGPGDEVLIQSLTYVASFQAISSIGATPIACEVDPATLTLDWRDAEKRITAKTKAVMPVHYAGGVGALDEIYSFANSYGLRVVEDAAHAFGSKYSEKRVGSFGDIACFSFDGIKNITSGEGGCIVTDDQNIVQKIQDARLLGVQKDTDKRFLGQRSWEFDVEEQGWRYHMSDIMAAIGIEQLKRFEFLAKSRVDLARTYDQLLKNNALLTPILSHVHGVVPHIYPIRIKGLVDRDILQNKLQSMGIQTGVHYQPNHNLSFYKKNNPRDLEVTEAVFQELLTLPLHPGLTNEDLKYVVSALNSALN